MEIKFRVYSEINRVMYTPEMDKEIGNLWAIPKAQGGLLNYPNGILMQSTGLKDKNGKEIYFKDAVRYLDESNTQQIGVVEPYNDVIGGYIQAINGDDEGNQDLQLHPDYQDTIEIIGNIFQHPELLEEE